MQDVQGNTNFIDKDGLVRNVYVGNQTVKTLTRAQDQLISITTELREKKKPILVLTDIRKLGTVTLQARIFAVDFIKTVDFDQVAIFGNPTVVVQVVNFIILASGRGFKTRYFSNENEAKKWLLRFKK